MNRRDLLRGVAAAGAAGTLAGCVSENDPDDTADGADSDSDPDPGADDDPDTQAPPSLAGSELVTAQGDCAGGGDRATASVEFDTAAVTVTGGVGTPNPCYEAELAEPSYDADADELTVTVAVTAEDVVCQSCVGVVRYEAAVEFDGGLPGAVTVRHQRDGETTTVTTTER